MRRIQVDMFEVQLGAAVLVQFSTPNGPVRVLADAGVKASGYPVDHVHGKLQDAFDSFGDPRRRLDLIIGTHYDEDHLVGLVPIIEDSSISIGEAWMPPVANDTQPNPRRPSRRRRTTCWSCSSPPRMAPRRLAEYLSAKHAVCQQISPTGAGGRRVPQRPAANTPSRPRPGGGPPGCSGRERVGAASSGPTPRMLRSPWARGPGT